MAAAHEAPAAGPQTGADGDRRPIAVITGASEGIGASFAAQLTAAGRDVLLVARDEQRLGLVADRLRALHPACRIAILSLDITKPDVLLRLDDALARLGAYPDLLVNNAGMGLSGPFATTPANRVAALLELNVTAATRLAHHVLPGQLRRRRGGILFVASLAGFAPGPGQAVYYASKAYMLSLSEALAAETAGQGVRISCVAPGPVDTAFHAKMGAEGAWYRWMMPAASPETVATRALLAHRLGIRVLVPDVFSLVAMLALRLLPHRLTSPLVRFLLSGTPLTEEL